MDEHGHALIEGVQGHIREALAPLFPENGQFALIDFPNHGNVGDSAIWMGEVEYFKQEHGADPVYVCAHDYYDEGELRAALPAGGTIFIHGGGNFGDLWAPHQALRETLIERFKDYKIVQLPQSIHYRDPANIERTKVLIAGHADFTLMVRDQESCDFSQEHFECPVMLVPDMAFYMGRLTSDVQKSSDVFYLKRVDHEKTDAAGANWADVAFAYVVDDWLEEPKDLYKRLKLLTLLSLPFKCRWMQINKNVARVLLYNALAMHRVRRGADMLASGRVVISDRLHAHILSVLLGIAHVRLDNNYQKIDRFARVWTKDSRLAIAALSEDEAVKIVQERLL